MTAWWARTRAECRNSFRALRGASAFALALSAGLNPAATAVLIVLAVAW